MPLPDLQKRSLPVLQEQLKHSRKVASDMRGIAKDLGLEPAFAQSIEALDDACDQIEQEIARRKTP